MSILVKKKETNLIFYGIIIAYFAILIFVALKAFDIIDPPETVPWLNTLLTIIVIGLTIIGVGIKIGEKFGVIETKIGGIDKDIDEIKIDLKDTKGKVYDIDKRLIKIEAKKKES